MTEETNTLQIFKSERTVSNMLIEHFVIPQQTSFEITQKYRLEDELQQQAVLNLVDRATDWMDLEEADQMERIKAVLLLETVAHFLYDEGTIREDCDLYENGFDHDGNILLDVYYIEDTEQTQTIRPRHEIDGKNREQRRAEKRAKKTEGRAKQYAQNKDNVIPLNLFKSKKDKGGH